MNYTNLTAEQVRTLQAAIVPLHNVMKEEAFLKALDLILGMANSGATALAAGVDAYTATLAAKLNADAGVTDADYVGSDL